MAIALLYYRTIINAVYSTEQTQHDRKQTPAACTPGLISVSAQGLLQVSYGVPQLTLSKLPADPERT